MLVSESLAPIADEQLKASLSQTALLMAMDWDRQEESEFFAHPQSRMWIGIQYSLMALWGYMGDYENNRKKHAANVNELVAKSREEINKALDQGNQALMKFAEAAGMKTPNSK